MKRKILITVILLAAAMLLCGCERIVLVPGQSSGQSIPENSAESAESMNPYPIILNDTEITASPQRVVSLTPAYTEIICEMGYGDRLAAVSKYCDYPETVTDLKRIDGGADPDTDAIIALNPDLVVTATQIVSKDRIALEAKGIKVLTIAAPETLDGFSKIYELFGFAFEGLFNGKEKGEAAFSAVKDAIDKTQEYEKVKFVYITAALSPAGGDTFESDVLSLFGENCAKDGSGYDYPAKSLLENQPDIIFLSSRFKQSRLENSEIYSQLDAVKNGNIVIIDNKYLERPTARITELLTQIEEHLIPLKSENDESGSAALDSEISSDSSDSTDSADSESEENAASGDSD